MAPPVYKALAELSSKDTQTDSINDLADMTLLNVFKAVRQGDQNMQFMFDIIQISPEKAEEFSDDKLIKIREFAYPEQMQLKEAKSTRAAEVRDNLWKFQSKIYNNLLTLARQDETLPSLLNIAKGMMISCQACGVNWEQIRANANHLQQEIEGVDPSTLPVDDLLECDSELLKQHFDRWFGEHPNLLKKFILSATGSYTLRDGQKVTVELTRADPNSLPFYRTCTESIYLPGDLYNYADYLSFKKRLNLSLEHASFAGGFQKV